MEYCCNGFVMIKADYQEIVIFTFVHRPGKYTYRNIEGKGWKNSTFAQI